MDDRDRDAGRETVKRGDFVVAEDDFEAAKETFAERSERSQALDKAFRVPITRDYDEWAANPRGLDFPGVDTPTSSPRLAVMDEPLPGDSVDVDRMAVDPHESDDSFEQMGDDLDESIDNMILAVTKSLE